MYSSSAISRKWASVQEWLVLLHCEMCRFMVWNLAISIIVGQLLWARTCKEIGVERVGNPKHQCLINQHKFSQTCSKMYTSLFRRVEALLATKIHNNAHCFGMKCPTNTVSFDVSTYFEQHAVISPQKHSKILWNTMSLKSLMVQC